MSDKRTPTSRQVAWAEGTIYAEGSDAILGEAPSWGEIVRAVPELQMKVYRTPNFAMTPDALHVPTGTYGVMREDGKVVSGTKSVAGQYQPFQNRELFEMVTEAGDGFGTTITGAGLYKGSTRAFMQVKLPFTITPGDDAREAIQMYATVVNSFDGSKALTVVLTTVRLACTNMLPMIHATGSGSLENIAIRHTQSGAKKIAALRDIFGDLCENVQETRQKIEDEIAREISENEFSKIVEAMYTIEDTDTDRVAANRESAQVAMRDAWAAGDATGIRGTAWGVRQAAARVDTHDADTPARQRRVFTTAGLGEAGSVAAHASRTMDYLVEDGVLAAA